MLKKSRYNIIIPIKTEDHSANVIFNTLSGTIDVVDNYLANWLDGLEHPSHGKKPSLEKPLLFDIRIHEAAEGRMPADEVVDYMDRRGYVLGTKAKDDEYRQSRMLYRNMIELHREAARQSFVIIPSYNCNLKCPYCWQRKYRLDSTVITRERVDALFDTIETFRVVDDPERVDAIVFGGEPLQRDTNLRRRVVQILENSKKKGYGTRIITNGVQLGENVPYIKDLTDLIQVTVDGTAEIHNKRRILPGEESFDMTVKGIATAVENDLRVNIRVNVDNRNIPDLPRLAEFIDSRGWLQTGLVKVYANPVKDHYCAKEVCIQSDYLMDVLHLAKSRKEMNIFDLSGFSGVKYFTGFKESGLFSPHRFFNCEAQISFFAFDVHGDVYPCWDSAGLKQFSIGTYDPKVEIDTKKLKKWRDRTSLDIDQCAACPSSPLCGGGCAFIAHENNGTLAAPSCDSMMQEFIAYLQENAAWILERAEEGDHTVGKLTFHMVQTETSRPFGMIEEPEIHG